MTLYRESIDLQAKSSLKFKILSKEEVKKLLKEIDNYNKNPHYSKETIEKTFHTENEYFGLFDGEICLSLLSTQENVPENGIIYIHELASFFPGKGYGMKLLNNILSRFENIWFMSNPEGGENLLKNYRKLNGLDEYVVKNSSYKGEDLHFFLKFSDENLKKKTIEFVENIWKN